MNKALQLFQFIAPEYLFIEIHEHWDEILLKSKLSADELNRVLSFLKTEISTIPFEFMPNAIKKARKISPDPDDVPYIALALHYQCPFWTHDKDLHKIGINTYNTSNIRNEIKNLLESMR